MHLRKSRTLWKACSVSGTCIFALALFGLQAIALTHKDTCYQAVVEGQVSAGQGFDRIFAKGLRFYLEPLRSGWIVRVLDADATRGPHDYAELATPPYQSVSPLLISTDWAFRAQDAIAWNPRHFRFAADKQIFRSLAQLQPLALAGDADAEARLSLLASTQPEATFQILNAHIAPGLANQAKMASVVALQLENTPHEIDSLAAPSPLGRVESMSFRVTLQLPEGVIAVNGNQKQLMQCKPKPTTTENSASQNLHSKLKR